MSTYTLDLIDSEARLHQLWQLDQSAYQDANIPFASFATWWQRYDLGLRVVENSRAEIVGAVGIWALSEETTRRFIAGQVTESYLQPLSVAELEQQPSQFWYFSGIVSRPPLQKTFGSPLRRLLGSGVRAWASSPHLRFPLHCYALGLSADGIALLDKLGFEVIKRAEELPDRLPLYWRGFQNLPELRGALR